jgi:hypothetical protein
VVAGSIPNQKSDLTRFYLNQEKTTDSYLYLGWQRANTLGNANMDFEFNQNKCVLVATTANGVTTTNPTTDSVCDANRVTPTRKSGDLLVTFDFEKGGKSPVLGLLKWLVSGVAQPNGVIPTAADCFSTNALPCWGADSTSDAADNVADNRVDLSDAGYANGAVNNGFSVSDPIAPTTAAPFAAANTSTARVLPDRTFGEAAIDLTAAQVFPVGQCVNFGSALLKSRSSTSFTAEMKDFIAPMPVSVTNCGSIEVTKTINGTPATPAIFQLYKDLVPAGTANSTSAKGAEDPLFTRGIATNLNGVVAAETSAVVTVDDASKFSGYTLPFYVIVGSEQMKVTAFDVDTDVLTLTRNVNGTAIASHNDDDGISVVPTCEFALTGTNACTFTNLPFGNYWVVETSAPTGYPTASAQLAEVPDSTKVSKSFSNSPSPIDVTINKKDGNNLAVPICQNVGESGCADFELWAIGTASTTLTVAAVPADTTFGVTTDASFPAGTKAIVDNEIVTASNASAGVVTVSVTRHELNTLAAAHAANATLTVITKTADCTPATTLLAAQGVCKFTSILPGSYVIVESVHPAGRSQDSALPERISIVAGAGNRSFTYNNAPLYKVITVVCRESDSSLYPSQLNYDAAIPSGAANVTPAKDSLGAITDAEICALSGAYVHSDVATGAHTGYVNIPAP